MGCENSRSLNPTRFLKKRHVKSIWLPLGRCFVERKDRQFLVRVQIAVCKGLGARRYRWYRLLQGPRTCQQILSTIAELDRERLDCKAQNTRVHGCQLLSLLEIKMCHLACSMIDSTWTSYTPNCILCSHCTQHTFKSIRILKCPKS